jgi:hypothetical protein
MDWAQIKLRLESTIVSNDILVILGFHPGDRESFSKAPANSMFIAIHEQSSGSMSTFFETVKATI